MFTQQQRQIFEYHDGEAKRFADPIHVQRELRRLAGCDPNDLVKRIAAAYPESGSEVDQATFEAAWEAEQRLHHAIRLAFRLKGFSEAEGTGCTTADVLALWERWCAWLDEKKSPPENSPTCSASMAMQS